MFHLFFFAGVTFHFVLLTCLLMHVLLSIYSIYTFEDCGVLSAWHCIAIFGLDVGCTWLYLYWRDMIIATGQEDTGYFRVFCELFDLLCLPIDRRSACWFILFIGWLCSCELYRSNPSGKAWREEANIWPCGRRTCERWWEVKGGVWTHKGWYNSHVLTQTEACFWFNTKSGVLCVRFGSQKP